MVVVGPAPVIVVLVVLGVGLLERASGEEKRIGGDFRAVADEGLYLFGWFGLVWFWYLGVWGSVFGSRFGLS